MLCVRLNASLLVPRAELVPRRRLRPLPLAPPPPPPQSLPRSLAPQVLTWKRRWPRLWQRPRPPASPCWVRRACQLSACQLSACQLLACHWSEFYGGRLSWPALALQRLPCLHALGRAPATRPTQTTPRTKTWECANARKDCNGLEARFNHRELNALVEKRSRRKTSKKSITETVLHVTRSRSSAHEDLRSETRISPKHPFSIQM